LVFVVFQERLLFFSNALASRLQDAHPSWNCTPSGQHLVDAADRNRQLESSAMVREQHLHRAAAARQLETLERIEEGRAHSTERDDALIAIEGRYVPPQAPADAGAGSFRHIDS
jgi:hypothetical protein